MILHASPARTAHDDHFMRSQVGTEAKQIQCPHCHSYKVIPVSPKKILFIGGFFSLAIGGLLAIFMIGIPTQLEQ